MESIATATLIKGSLSNSISIIGYSFYSLKIKALNNESIVESGDFDSLILNIGDNSYALGSCRVIPDAKSNRTVGNLVFTGEQYDLDELLNKNNVSIQETSFFSLPLIISQKESVSDSFKKFSADLTFELMVYKQFFDHLDWKIAKEPSNIQKYLQENAIAKEGREFLEFFHSKIELLKTEIIGLTKERRDAQGFFFRKQLWDFILESNFMTRTNVKPRGYAGDYRMMQMISDNEYKGKSIFSKLVHKYPLETKAAQAVRNRIELVKEKIFELSKNKSEFKIFSVASGPCLEIEKIFTSNSSFNNLSFTLLDQDEEALDAAKNKISSLEKKFKAKAKVKFLNESVRNLSRSKIALSEAGQYDFIYSMGLFDYLAQPVAKAIFIKLFSMLKKGGTLFIGNFHNSCPDKDFMEYWLDWVLYYRTEKDFKEFADSISAAKQNIFLEDAGCQMFLEVSS